MFWFFCFAAAAAAQATPVGKSIPVFEDIPSLHPSGVADPRIAQRALCTDDCHHHVLNKPLFIVRSLPGSHTLHFAPIGLNGLAKSPMSASLQETIMSPEPKVLVIFPFARFPFELFPGLVDAEVVIPEHVAKLSSVYKEAPIVAIFSEDEFHQINERRGLIQVAELAADASGGFVVARDHALVNRNAALGAPLSSPQAAAPAMSPLAFASREATPAAAQGFAQPATFVPAPPSSVGFPSRLVAGGFSQVPGSGIGSRGEGLKYISNAPIGQSYYTSIPFY